MIIFGFLYFTNRDYKVKIMVLTIVNLWYIKAFIEEICTEKETNIIGWS